MTTDIIPTEDFWSRKRNAQTYAWDFRALSHHVFLTANNPVVLNAAYLSEKRFSLGRDQYENIGLEFAERPTPAESLPNNWPENLVFSGSTSWISQSVGEWGYSVGSLQTKEAFIVLARPLAEQTQLISRYFIDHNILNFSFLYWAMLHASCVVDAARQKLVAFIGAHNIGKSTAALQLLRAGWHFLADGMLLIRNDSSPRQFEIGGYPIGEVKLRDDVFALFPEYAGEKVRVREQRKTVVNLRAVHPERVVENVLTPREIHLCFAERSETSQTSLASIAIEAARERVAQNTIYWDEPPMLKRNSKILLELLATARLHHLRLGTNTAELLTLLESL